MVVVEIWLIEKVVKKVSIQGWGHHTCFHNAWIRTLFDYIIVNFYNMIGIPKILFVSLSLNLGLPRSVGTAEPVDPGYCHTAISLSHYPVAPIAAHRFLDYYVLVENKDRAGCNCHIRGSGADAGNWVPVVLAGW